MKRIVAAYLTHRELSRAAFYNLAVLIFSIVVGSCAAFLLAVGIEGAMRTGHSSAGGESITREVDTTLQSLGLSTRRIYPAHILADAQALDWGVDQKQLSERSYFVCVSKGGSELQLLGITELPDVIALHAAESCAERDAVGLVPMQTYIIAQRTSKLGIPLLPDYKIGVFPENHVDLIFSRLGRDLAMGGRGVESDRSSLAARALSTQLFSFREAGFHEKIMIMHSATTSWFHRIIIIAFVFAMTGLSLIYWVVIRDADTKRRFSLGAVKSRLKFYQEVLHALPTLSLIGTMTGLTITLAEFLGRSSSDPTEAIKANSAALGGIILAFTTTIMAALLLLIGWNLIAVNLDARLEAEFE